MNMNEAHDTTAMNEASPRIDIDAIVRAAVAEALAQQKRPVIETLDSRNARLKGLLPRGYSDREARAAAIIEAQGYVRVLAVSLALADDEMLERLETEIAQEQERAKLSMQERGHQDYLAAAAA